MQDQSAGAIETLVAQHASRQLSRRSLLKRAGALGLTAGAIGPLLAACGTSASPGASASGKPVRGGTFKEGYDRDFTPVNPVANAWADPDYNAFYEALVIRTPEGQIVPMLADKFSSSASGWTFHLRQGLKFQSGAPVTPQAVIEDFDLFRSPKTGQNGPFWGPITSVTAQGEDIVCATKGP
jgi:peptide/nickel transport system substrate-binding protein